MSLKFRYYFIALLSLILAAALAACSLRNESDFPNAAGGDGKGDATNTLRYQNRSVK